MGHPSRPFFVEYCAPCLIPEDKALRNHKIDVAFCGFNKRIFCEGNVLNTRSSELLIGDYSGTSGMSGSPVYLNGKVCGINVGGASLKYQYELGQIIRLSKELRFKEARKLLYHIKSALMKDQDFNFANLSASIWK